jgi:uncharacterized membrane protein YfcA
VSVFTAALVAPQPLLSEPQTWAFIAIGFLVVGVRGPLVTRNLVAHGAHPRHAVGTGNLAETFVAIAVFTVLVRHIGFAQLCAAVIGLLIGAGVAAPVGAGLASKLPRRVLMMGVGVLVILMSLLRLVRDLPVWRGRPVDERMDGGCLAALDASCRNVGADLSRAQVPAVVARIHP